MTQLMATSIGVGVGCLLWSLASTLAEFPTWMGFVGCTAYFAAGAGKTSSFKALCSNWTGILWGVAVLELYGAGFMQDKGASLIAGALAVGFIAWGMTYQSRFSVLGNVPNTFMGCFSLFAANGDWLKLLIGVSFGVGLGFVCDYTGKFLFRMVGKPIGVGSPGGGR